MQTYDQNSIVDVLRQMGKPTDIASRAQLATDMKITPDAASYISAANTGSNASQNTALIAALKGMNQSQPVTPSTPKAPTVTTPTTPVVPPVNNQNTGTPVLGSVQYDLANGLPVGTSSQAGYKAPITPTTNSQTGGNSNNVLDGVKALMGNVAKPTTSDQATKDLEVKNAQQSTEDALTRAYEPQINAINTAMNNELASNDEDSKEREQAMLQNLAVRGILNVSSEDPVLRKKHYASEGKISSAIRDKYTLQIMAIKGKIGDDAYKAGIKRAEDIITREKNAMDAYYKELESQNSTYKLLSDEQLANKNLELEREKAEVDKKYKEGSLTIDQYNSETNRIKAESDKLVNQAQVRKLDADTAKTTSETVVQGGTNGKVGEQITFLQDVASKADALSGASGAGSIQRNVSNLFSGSNQPNQLSQYVDTLKVNLLALATDPTIKKFFGPQMSNADVALMTSAGTTLNAEKNTPAQMKSEITRITELLGRMQSSVNGGTTPPKASTGDNVTIQKPDGTTGTIPKANLDAALKLGAKQI